MTENKKRPLNIKLVVTVLILILSACLVAGIVIHLNQGDPNKITAVKSTSSPSSTSSPASTLPSECTDVNSYQYLLTKKFGVLSPEFVPGDLADPENVQSTSGVFTVRQEVAGQLESMIKAAKEAGVSLLVSAGYRSYNDQELQYSSFASLGEATASITCEKAGYSEHQLGLAVDFTDNADTPNQTVSFADTDAGKWLMEHAHEYGFILRYPEGKESITGYSYMPWHYRYVGTDVANAIYAMGSDCTMEEYYGIN